MTGSPLTRNFIAHLVLIFSASAFPLFAGNATASTYTHRTLYSFCKSPACADGDHPEGGLVKDPTGTLYGTAVTGGRYGFGAVYQLVPNANKTKWTQSIIHSFCSEGSPCMQHGDFPGARLVLDIDGRLYGTFLQGGAFGLGGVFELKKGTKGWSYSIVYQFCSTTNCPDGSQPTGGLSYRGQSSGARWDESSPLFGTTLAGGANGRGVVYALTGGGSSWNQTVIHSLSTGLDAAPVAVDSHGNVFGASFGGGANNKGVIYRLDAGTWQEHTLYNFCGRPSCSDGAGPGSVTVDKEGNIFGTTRAGGNLGCPNSGDQGCGVVYKRATNGSFKVLHTFCSSNGCSDGRFGGAALTLDKNGNLFGTTLNGGTHDGGVVFRFASAQEPMEVIYSFCTASNCANGEEPNGSLIFDKNNNIFGTTYSGGAHDTGSDGGTAFELM